MTKTSMLQCKVSHDETEMLPKGRIEVGVVVGLFILFLLNSTLCFAESFITEASYFTYESCIKEGNTGRMANGQILNNNDLVCASRDFRISRTNPVYLNVTDLGSGRSVQVKVADFGPNLKLYKRGRRLDLSKRAFEILSGGRLDKGLFQVQIERSD